MLFDISVYLLVGLCILIWSEIYIVLEEEAIFIL